MTLNSLGATHCVKSVRIRSYCGPYSVRMRENTDQNNSEYGHFSCSDSFIGNLLLDLSYLKIVFVDIVIAFSKSTTNLYIGTEAVCSTKDFFLPNP